MSIYGFLNNKKDTMDPDPKKRNFHSRFYHRYFEDYIEYETISSSGKSVIVRKYKGSWYIEEGDRSRRIKRRLVSAALGLLTIGFFAGAACMPVTANRLIYGAIGQVILFALLVLKAFAFNTYRSLEERITIGDYRRGFERYHLCSKLIPLAFILCAFLFLLCMFIKKEEAGPVILAVAFCLAGAVTAYRQYKMLEDVSYYVVDNDATTLENAAVIRKRDDHIKVHHFKTDD